MEEIKMSKHKTTTRTNFLTFNVLVTIVTLFCLMMGAFFITQQSCKIIETGYQLITLSEKAQYYNESINKTDEMTKEYLKNNEERQAIYNSEDTVIRVFSNLPTLFKAIVLLLAILAIPVVIVIVLLYVAERVNTIKRKTRLGRRK